MNLRVVRYFLAITLLVSLFLGSKTVTAQAQDPFQWFFDGETREVNSQDTIPIEINFVIPPGYILYKQKFELTQIAGEGYDLSALEMPAPLVKPDPISGGVEEVYEDAVVLKATLTPKQGFAPKNSENDIKLQIAYQGCSEKLCFKPTKKEMLLPLKYKDVQNTGGFGSTNFLSGKGIITLILLTFLGGLLSDFTPCVLPIIPITLAFIGIKKSDTSHWHNFVQTLVMVISMSLSYAFMGLVVALLGKSLGFLFQSTIFLFLAVALYVFFALSMFGLYEIQLPMGIRNRLAKLGGKGTVGSILSGITVGLLAAPCIGPLIGSLLVYVAQEKDLLKGFVLLFSYGLGMGSLFLVVGTYYHRLAPKVHGGPFTMWIKRAFGVLLLIPAFYYGSIAWAGLKGKSASEKSSASQVWFTDADAAMKKAAKENKPIFMDFYADWCVPCLEMEKNTFSKPNVETFLQETFIPIKIDCTEETPQCKKYVDRYKVIGWPTMLVLDSKGNLKETFVGEDFRPKEFIKRIGEAAKK